VFFRLGEFGKAHSDYSEAISRRPGNVSALKARAESCFRQHRWAAALDDLNAVLALVPSDTHSRIRRSIAYAYVGNLHAAISDLDGVLEEAPDDWVTRRQRAYVYCMQGRYELAKEEFDAVLRHGKQQGIYFGINRFLLGLRTGAPNEELPSAAVAEGENREWCEALLNYIRGEIAEGELLAIVSSVVEAERSQRLCELYYYVGIVHLLKNNSEAAVEYFEKCVTTNPVLWPEALLARYELARISSEAFSAASRTEQRQP
jgi:lipoprotein NlpI